MAKLANTIVDGFIIHKEGAATTSGTTLTIDYSTGTTFELDMETFGARPSGDIDTFTVLNGKSGVEVVIGYSSTNTNRVNIPVETTTSDITDPVTFTANLFKEVLVANRECTSATLEVSTEGLARVNFKVDDYDSTYYVVAMQDVD